jgi:stage II sporulation protein P
MNRIHKMSLPHLFILLSLCSSLFILPIVWLIGNSFITVSTPTMRQAVSQISHKMILGAFEMEIPYLTLKSYDQEDPPMPLSLYLFETLTNLDPEDLTSMFASEIPNLTAYNLKQLAKTETYPQVHQVDSVAQAESSEKKADTTQTAETTNNKEEEKKKSVADPTREVLLYNTHNTESWSFASNNPSVTDEKTNITLVNKKLSEELEKKGVKTKVDNTDHQKNLRDEGLPYVFSYAESLKTVKEALKQDKNISYIFDLHRDSMPRKVTTATIDGKSYARIVLVIGKGNPQWEKNQKLAEKINDLLNKKYPGVSRGINMKTTAEGNGEYNQSLSPNSILIEVGGIDNSLEESYNAASALADVIADIYFETDQKVDAPSTKEQKRM